MTPDDKKPAIAQPPCWDCEQDPIGSLKQMFVDIVQSGRIKLGQDPARHFVWQAVKGCRESVRVVQGSVRRIRLNVYTQGLTPTRRPGPRTRGKILVGPAWPHAGRVCCRTWLRVTVGA